MATYATKASDIARRWLLVDADGQVLGRMASEVASLLKGKHKPNYVPYLDLGDPIVIINARRFRVTGRKREQKSYFRHSNYPGGAKFTTFADRMKKDPSGVVRDAVWGMLPKGPLGRKMIQKLKIYDGPEHPHQAQMPKPYQLGRRLMQQGNEE